jgi:mannose-6-phosphate isomerase-like protein (cupin superfamily)
MTTSTTPTGAPDLLGSLLVLDSAEIDAMPWQPVEHAPGVRMKILWRYDDYVQALLHAEPGATIPGRPHLVAHHHIWVVSGSGTVAGRHLTAGSYVYVPPGAEHHVDDVGPEGCVVLQIHHPHPPQEAAR